MNITREIDEYMNETELKRIRDFSRDRETPFLLINLKQIEKKYLEMERLMPYARIFYAVKANPNMEVLRLLARMGASFDIASIPEMEQVLNLGVSPDRISYGNTIKKERDVAAAYKNGIRLYCTDSHSDLQKIGRVAPGSKVFFRIARESQSADWPLSRKFGAHPDMVYELILASKNLGLIPYGLSFHVGSQQRDIGQWDGAIAQCNYLFDGLRAAGIELQMINMGGGFPANYLQPSQGMEVYTQEITRFLKDDFGDNLPEIFIEPGRSLVADAGVLVSEVVMISRKARFNQYKWVYLDSGKFNGLIETTDEAIKYPIFPEADVNGRKLMETIIAGPTCDSLDILYETFRYYLPEDLKEGDRMLILTAGAYTASYSSIYFNGFSPLKEYTVEWD